MHVCVFFKREREDTAFINRKLNEHMLVVTSYALTLYYV